MNLNFDVYHVNIHEAEFNFMDRGAWCSDNCVGVFEIGSCSAHFELKNDYLTYGKHWEIERFFYKG